MKHETAKRKVTLRATDVPLGDEQMAGVRALVADVGEKAAGKRLGISDATLSRVLAGRRITSGTRAQITLGLQNNNGA